MESTQDAVGHAIAAHRDMPGALLPLLHAVQDAVGHIPADAIAQIAQALHLSRAEVHGVVSYYHHFRTQPAGQQVVQICQAEACQSMGADTLWNHACKYLELDATQALHGATTADQRITLQPVYCLGLCSSSPALSINERVHARVGTERLVRLLDSARSAP